MNVPHGIRNRTCKAATQFISLPFFSSVCSNWYVLGLHYSYALHVIRRSKDIIKSWLIIKTFCLWMTSQSLNAVLSRTQFGLWLKKETKVKVSCLCQFFWTNTFLFQIFIYMWIYLFIVQILVRWLSFFKFHKPILTAVKVWGHLEMKIWIIRHFCIWEEQGWY